MAARTSGAPGSDRSFNRARHVRRHSLSIYERRQEGASARERVLAPKLELGLSVPNITKAPPTTPTNKAGTFVEEERGLGRNARGSILTLNKLRRNGTGTAGWESPRRLTGALGSPPPRRNSLFRPNPWKLAPKSPPNRRGGSMSALSPLYSEPQPLSLGYHSYHSSNKKGQHLEARRLSMPSVSPRFRPKNSQGRHQSQPWLPTRRNSLSDEKKGDAAPSNGSVTSSHSAGVLSTQMGTLSITSTSPRTLPSPSFNSSRRGSNTSRWEERPSGSEEPGGNTLGQGLVQRVRRPRSDLRVRVSIKGGIDERKKQLKRLPKPSMPSVWLPPLAQSEGASQHRSEAAQKILHESSSEISPISFTRNQGGGCPTSPPPVGGGEIITPEPSPKNPLSMEEYPLPPKPHTSRSAEHESPKNDQDKKRLDRRKIPLLMVNPKSTRRSLSMSVCYTPPPKVRHNRQGSALDKRPDIWVNRITAAPVSARANSSRRDSTSRRDSISIRDSASRRDSWSSNPTIRTPTLRSRRNSGSSAGITGRRNSGSSAGMALGEGTKSPLDKEKEDQAVQARRRKMFYRRRNSVPARQVSSPKHRLDEATCNLLEKIQEFSGVKINH
ncbi:hypothetical protein AAMO2058_000346100 [Amorphochlora amoebiformis]